MMKNSKNLRIIFAGDRDISVRILDFITKQGVKPLALILSDKKHATHNKELAALAGYLDDSYLLIGKRFRSEYGIKLLKKLKPDYIISIHFPYIFPKEILKIPTHGVINLHPAYLPYNRGWHTPTWAIWENTPYGATLHFMDEGIDSGDIIHQKLLKIRPNDTAHALYERVKKLEFKVFKETWPAILKGTYTRKPQPDGKATFHNRKDISSIQNININRSAKISDLIRQLRALTTDNIKEAAYYKIKNKSYRVQIQYR